MLLSFSIFCTVVIMQINDDDDVDDDDDQNTHFRTITGFRECRCAALETQMLTYSVIRLGSQKNSADERLYAK